MSEIVIDFENRTYTIDDNEVTVSEGTIVHIPLPDTELSDSPEG